MAVAASVTIVKDGPCYSVKLDRIKSKRIIINEGQNAYPSKILGFININGNDEAVIQCANKHLCWDDLIKHLIIPITIGCQFDVSFVVVPIESIVHPLCSIPVDEENNNRFLVVLPKRNWSAYFGKHIKV